jgi:hypothetical protein
MVFRSARHRVKEQRRLDAWNHSDAAAGNPLRCSKTFVPFSEMCPGFIVAAMELVVLIAFGIVWALFLPVVVLHAMVQADVSAIGPADDTSTQKEA